jgi:hypothetical protein
MTERNDDIRALLEALLQRHGPVYADQLSVLWREEAGGDLLHGVVDLAAR